MQEIWDTMKEPNLRIIGKEKGEDCPFGGTENIFNKIIEENLLNLKKEMTIRVQEAYRTPLRLDQKRKSFGNIISTQNKERILNAVRGKDQVTTKLRPRRITPDFSAKILKQTYPGQI